jgi:hypothetical protein
VVIQPLTSDAVDRYLTRAGDLLAGLRQALSVDAALADLFTTPLFLSIGVLAYRRSATTVAGPMAALAELRRQFLADYADVMLRRAAAEPPAGSESAYRR